MVADKPENPALRKDGHVVVNRSVAKSKDEPGGDPVSMHGLR
jgi:hypothetical protein